MTRARSMRYGVLGAGAVALMAGAVVAWRYAAAPSAEQQFAMLDRYCTECHNPAELAGGLSLEQLDHSDIHAQAEIWEKVVRKLRGGLMPPPGGPRPEAQQIAAVRRLHGGEHRCGRGRRPNLRCSAAAPAQPQGVRERRARSARTRDRRGDLAAARRQSSGFDNIADALQVSPSFIEQYVTAARTIADRALGDAGSAPESQTYKNPIPGVGFGSTIGGGRPHHIDGLPLGTRDGFVVNHFFPADGEYQITISDMVGALWVYNLEFENTLIVTVDGVKVFETVIGGDADQKAIDQDQDPAVAAINSRLKNIRFAAKAGQQKVGRRLPAPHACRVRRPSASAAARLRPRHRPGSRDARRLVRGCRPVQSHGRERDAEPRQDLQLLSARRRTRSCRAPRRSWRI